ncbi:hypothetical protein [Paraglaciecola psychrophila]|uniref:Uncharacterized protein n=1 Tax=Paraglaciecola psychrophila 170 TaxID=1129794 RepID=K7AIX6_9ALTE|nr:hypothetical protein [Paraglaciecola psychrophila]AGH44067.1 hypothetical protein C427_1958 [Paraglaciecola psychrophila 170]GAC40528.1 hypothetical protein GPSY_4927 [Paraglaciecola psychrophila 170]
MDDFLKGVYISEVKKQCEFGLAAIKYLNHALQQTNNRDLEKEESSFYHSEVFRQIHSFLTHASNVSRIIWPPQFRQKKKETDEEYEQRLQQNDKVVRGRVLKEEYDLDDSNPLKQRTLRDHLEHYDERLDHWRNNNTNRVIVSDIIGPANTIVGPAESGLMRWFDPTRNVFKFRGEEFDLQTIATSIDAILSTSRTLENELRERRFNTA